MTVVCRPYRLEDAERELLFRLKHGRRLSITRFVLGVMFGALAVAGILHVAVGGVLAEIAPEWAAARTTVPILALIATLVAGVFFARRMDAAMAVVPAMPEQTVTIAPDGIRVETPVSVTDWRWTAWTRVHDAPEALLLEEPSGAMLVLPDRAFADAATRAAARAMVATHVPPAEAPAQA
ncbi:MAG: hypothetical protein GX458_03500 [Phyllobacteriaceae bacterium]|nr:hypothetical protein [Phyllobacteriaceae bacterium]